MTSLPVATLRRYRPDDLDAVLALFHATVRTVNLGDYTLEQVRAWAPDEPDRAAWSRRLEQHHTVVAAEPGRLVGFADLTAAGLVDCFFVAADRQRRGVGGRLLAELAAEAERRSLPALTSEVSITARPFFERHGFTVDAEQTVVCRGVKFLNFRMRRPLRAMQTSAS